MKVNDIREIISYLRYLDGMRDEILTDNGGEVTEEVESIECEFADLSQKLEGEGVDMLGRWICSLEDKKDRAKAEKDFITRQISAIEDSIDYAKSLVRAIMDEGCIDQVKGNTGYKFKRYVSCTTSVDKPLVNELYAEKLRSLMDSNGIPRYITFTLGASVKAVEEGAELPEIFSVTNTPTVQFSKPRKK